MEELVGGELCAECRRRLDDAAGQFCPRCKTSVPTPAHIKAVCAEIQAGWSADEVHQHLVDKSVGSQRWQVPRARFTTGVLRQVQQVERECG